MRHQSEDLPSSDHKSSSLTLGGLSISHYREVCKAYNLHGRSTRLNPCKFKEQCRCAAKSAGRFLGIRAQNGTAWNSTEHKDTNGVTLLTAKVFQSVFGNTSSLA